MTLFPRKVFNDTLPLIVLKHQLYSILSDKTMVDRQLVRCLSYALISLFPSKSGNTTQVHPCGLQNELRERGELLMFQLGFGDDAFGLVFASDYKAKVLAGEEGRVTRGTAEKFLEKVVSSGTDLSFSKDQMLTEYLFTDSEITYGRTSFRCLLFFTFSFHGFLLLKKQKW